MDDKSKLDQRALDQLAREQAKAKEGDPKNLPLRKSSELEEQRAEDKQFDKKRKENEEKSRNPMGDGNEEENESVGTTTGDVRTPVDHKDPTKQY